MKKKKTTKKTTNKKVQSTLTKSKPLTKKQNTNETTQIETKAITSQKDKKRLYRTSSVVVLVLALLVLVGYFVKDYFIIATVDGTPITRYELMTEMEKNYGKDVTDGLISKILVQKEAKRKGISVSQDEINKEIDKLKAKTLQQGFEWEDALKQQRLTEDILRNQLKYQILVQKLLKDQLIVTDKDVEDYINKNKETFKKQKITDEMKKNIKDGLSSQKAQTVITPWLKQLKEKSKIEYRVKF